MRNFKLVIAYEGTHYFGWQKVNDQKTIEGELERALRIVLRHDVQLQAASRTDRGVHAKAQVVNFFTPEAILLSRLRLSLNALLPKDIAVVSVEEVGASFHPTLDAKGKEYHYDVCLGRVQLPFYRLFSWHFGREVDEGLIERATEHLVGRRDFAAFCNDLGREGVMGGDERTQRRKGAKEEEGKDRPLGDTVRMLEGVELQRLAPDRLRFKVKGERFLYRMVRNLVGTLLYIGSGKLEGERLPEILASGKRSEAGVTAPAHGLTLARVFY